MRVLLDENMDRRLRRFFDTSFDVVTVTEQGWSGKKNGDLLRLAEQAFDVLVTMDQNLRYQQNLSAYDLAVVVILARSNRRQDIEPMIPEVNRLLREIKSGELRIVVI